jgi:hypothetical protein
MRPWLRDALQTLAAGAAGGLLVLGLGGRLAMAAIQFQSAGESSWTFGGTMTVVLLGGASGLAGAAMLLLSEWIMRRIGAPPWTAYLLLAVMLGLVTLRGLRGTVAVGALYFYPLVGVYGALLVLSSRFLRVRSAGPQRGGS